MLWCEVNMRRAGGWQGPHCLERLMNYLGVTPTFPPSNSASTQNNNLFANQNIGGREAQRRVEERVVGRPSSLLPGLLLWCDAVQWNPDTIRKQRIPFDVSHNFVLPTKMNI